MKGELNSRQWALYNLLRNNPDEWFSQLQIARCLAEYYPLERKDYTDFHRSKAHHTMTKDIQKLNDSDVIQKVILSTSAGHKLASKEEFERYINGQFAAIFRKLERTRKKARKAGLDGQMRFTVGRERDTIEAFSDDINRLKAARLNAGLKLVDVVKELCKTEKGIDVPLLSKMERGYCQPSNRLLLKLADIYGTEPYSLIGDEVIEFDGIA